LSATRMLSINGRVRFGLYHIAVGLKFYLTGMLFFLETERVTELETLVKSLESQLEEQERDASEAITQWQNNATEADEKAREIEEKLSQEVSSLQSTTMEIDEERSTLKQRVAELQNSLASMQSTLDHSERDADLAGKLERKEQELHEAKETLTRDEDVVKQWEGKYFSPWKSVPQNY
jgi:DNA repair exonuclease SbcCD ATPase subunit